MKGDIEEEADELSIGTFNKACIDCFSAAVKQCVIFAFDFGG